MVQTTAKMSAVVSLMPVEHDPPLTRAPQFLGIAPTMWFWNRPQNARAATIVLLPVLLLLQILCISMHAVLGPVGAGLVAGGGTYLAFGLLERYIRRQCVLRRHTPWSQRYLPHGMTAQAALKD